MKSKLWLIPALLFSGFTTMAQNDADYLRYSVYSYGATARSMAMGNSFSALGADFSTLSINPAGLGVYRRSEFSFSPTFANRNNASDFGGNANDDNHFKFNFGNFGFIFSNKRGKNDPWKYLNFGVGYNRTNNFSSNEFARFDNAQNSLLDNYTEELNITKTAQEDIPAFYPYDIDLAWQTYAINYDSASASYYNALPFGGARQTRTTERRGGQGEWAFSVAGNYDDRLYVGATMGIPVVRHIEESTWLEEDTKDTIPYFKSYRYDQTITTSGAGINFKLGAIYRFTDAIRMGVAVHTPTWLTLTDDYTASARSDLDSGFRFNYSGPEFIPFEYRVNSPFRVITSFAIVAKGVAAFNFDYEFLDYSQGKIKSVAAEYRSYFTETNRAIRAKYSMQHNFRFGLEFPVDAFRYRLGAEYSTSPFDLNMKTDDSNYDMSRMTFSGGIGYRSDKYFFDAAYAWSKFGTFTYPYTLENEETPAIKSAVTDNRVMFTVGWLF